MQSLNKWSGIGRLGRDPEIKTTQSGTNVCSFTLACERRKGKGEEKAEVDWINCVAWKSLADLIGNYCKKGDQLAIEGRIQTRNYEDKDGKKVYVTEIVAEFIQLLEPKEKKERPEPDEKQFSNNVHKGNSLTQDDISEQLADGISDELPF